MDMAIVWIIAYLVVLVLLILKYILFNMTLIVNLEEMYRKNITNCLFHWCYPKMCMISFLNIRYGRYYNWFEFMNAIIAGWVIFAVLTYPSFEVWSAVQYLKDL